MKGFSNESLFQFVNLLPIPFWFLMICLPNWRFTRLVMARVLAIIPLLAIYAALVIPGLGQLTNQLPRTLDDLARLFAQPDIALAAWIHFLAFDLFVGRWIYLDSQKRRISAWPMAPVLVFSFLLGPIGLLAYLLLRTLWQPRNT